MLIKGSKIKMINAIPGFDRVGDTFEVQEIDEFCIQIKSNYGIGVMSYKEFEQFFEIVVEEEKKEPRKWSEWQKIHLLPLNKKAAYRHNGKAIEMICHNVKVKTSCHPEDEFNLDKGIEIATVRLKLKFAELELENLTN